MPKTHARSMAFDDNHHLFTEWSSSSKASIFAEVERKEKSKQSRKWQPKSRSGSLYSLRWSSSLRARKVAHYGFYSNVGFPTGARAKVVNSVFLTRLHSNLCTQLPCVCTFRDLHACRNAFCPMQNASLTVQWSVHSSKRKKGVGFLMLRKGTKDGCRPFRGDPKDLGVGGDKGFRSEPSTPQTMGAL